MLFLEKRSMPLRLNTHDQIVFVHSTRHVAIQKKSNPTEHFLFNKWDAIQLRANSVGELLVVCHV
jgi:hypothetical protein